MRAPSLRAASFFLLLCFTACDCKDKEGDGDAAIDGDVDGSMDTKCGNGIRGDTEACDDGNKENEDGCSKQCEIEPGYTCLVPGQPCFPCGNGSIEAGEQCDDGAQVDDDGCSATCQREPGWDCIGNDCTPSICGDGFRVGAEDCDDGNTTSGDGCSIRCDVEDGWFCVTPNRPCAQAVCGDGSINAQEECDDGDMDNTPPGCDANCEIVPGYYCPTPGQPCMTATCGDGVVQGPAQHGLEQCDDANNPAPGCSASCQLEAGYHCPTPGQACVMSMCGNGVREGLEECDDDDTDAGDGCDGTCHVEAFYECSGATLSVCKKPVEFVRIARFAAPMQQPQAVHYDPRTRSFVAYDFTADTSTNDAQEFCLDGTTTEIRDEALEARRDLVGGTSNDNDSLDGAAYDPFNDTFLFVQQSGRLTEIERTDTTLANVTITSLMGLGTGGGVQVGDDGRIYATNHYAQIGGMGSRGRVLTFTRTGMTVNTTSVSQFQAHTHIPSPENMYNPYLDNIFNIPGMRWIGYYNLPEPLVSGSPTEQVFAFHRYDGTFIGSSRIPGILFRNGETFPHNADGGEAAVDGGYFLVCSEYLDEPGGGTVLDGICQLFAQTCTTTADCAERVPGTICKTSEAIPYCYAPAVARDDQFPSAANAPATALDVLRNDAFADAVCQGATPMITAVTTPNHGGTVTITPGNASVTYTPMGVCGYDEVFEYTANLGGGIIDTAQVTVHVPCACGNNMKDPGEECDGTDVPSGRECTAQCYIKNICGNMILEAGEQCDDGNTTAGDTCSPICTSEIVID